MLLASCDLVSHCPIGVGRPVLHAQHSNKEEETTFGKLGLSSAAEWDKRRICCRVEPQVRVGDSVNAAPEAKQQDCRWPVCAPPKRSRTVALVDARLGKVNGRRLGVNQPQLHFGSCPKCGMRKVRRKPGRRWCPRCGPLP